MAERDDQMARDARNAQSGQNEQGQDRDALDQALQRRNEDLAGDIETNRNLTGSSTYETLHEQGDLDVASGDATGGAPGGSSGGSGSDRDRDRNRDRGGSSGGMR